MAHTAGADSAAGTDRATAFAVRLRHLVMTAARVSWSTTILLSLASCRVLLRPRGFQVDMAATSPMRL